ncbi:MAG: peptide chain release factor N(5)-glutamine methyltransferase [Alteromonadaceae bacterium]|nr:peptide chain release factor N(5)-glutamine methyltransferase [Alteromonadaceae bacterium]
MLSSQTCSIASAIEQGTIALSQLSDSAKLDSQLLLAFALVKNVTYLLTWPEKVITATQFIVFQQLLTRRVNGEPIAYILGEKEFWSLPLKVSSATLIPRPDTEILVEQVLTLFTYHDKSNTGGKNSQNIRGLDLGTGTGAIALALASECPCWQLDAVDFNQEAVELAQQNAKNLKLTHVKIYQSDWFSQIDAIEKFDFIISNPPYIDGTDQHLTQGDVRFEPKSALVADEKGFKDIRLIAEQARKYLKNNGYLLFEHGFEQAEKVRQILIDLGYDQVQSFKDYANNDRITQATWLMN